MDNKVLDKEIEKLTIYDFENKKDYEKGIILPIYFEDKFIGNIIVNENLEVTSGLAKGYKIEGLE